MIRVEQISDEDWLVTVTAKTTTKHRVRVTSEDLRQFGGGTSNVEQLLQASFRFLLEREPNTSILEEFHLPTIERYFPEYERDVQRYLAET